MGEADATTLVPAQVHDDAATLCSDCGHRIVELGTAVAAMRAEHIAREAFAVHPARTGSPSAMSPIVNARCSTPSRDSSQAWQVNSRALWYARLGDLARRALFLEAMADQVGDRDHRQAMLRCERLELGSARHIALVGTDDLTQHARRPDARETRQVDRRLGVAGAFENAAGTTAQREDVAGTDEVLRLGGESASALQRRRAVRGGDTRGYALARSTSR